VSDFILDTARSIMAVMQPATGDRSSGPVTIKALPTTVANIKRGTIAYPILRGQINPKLLFKVDKNPATEDGSWDVTDAGTDVTFISNVGGEKHNLPAGTELRLDPLTAVLVVGDTVVAAGGLTGATTAAGFGAVKDMLIAEQVDGPILSLDLRRSGLTSFPAVVVSWKDSIPSDGSTQVQASRGAARVGTRSLLFSSSYVITLFSAREDSEHARRHEGMFITGLLARLVSDRHSVDGECFSNPSPLQIRNIFREVGQQDIYQKYYVYHILVSAMSTLQSIDGRTYSDFLLATLNIDKPQDPALPNQGDIDVVVDNEVPIPP